MRDLEYADDEDRAELNAEPWMFEMLSLNPGYVHWGPHEDYMWKKRDGWDSPITNIGWSQFELSLDELNECVNFYFQIDRKSKACGSCNGEGYNPETQKIAEEFYDMRGCFMGGSGHGKNRWCDKITVDEVQALVDHNRLFDLTHHVEKGKGWVPNDPFPVIDEAFTEKVNAWERGRGMGHDAINRGILVETRAKRLGVYGRCPECNGHGYSFVEDKGTLNLVLWVLHPRKGASRGWEILDLKKDDMPAVLKFLREAAERNFQRFQKAIEFAGAVAK